MCVFVIDCVCLCMNVYAQPLCKCLCKPVCECAVATCAFIFTAGEQETDDARSLCGVSKERP